MLNHNQFRPSRPYNAARELIDANIARGFAKKVAFTDGERSLTFGELQSRTFRFGAALRSLGVPRESRVAILLSDTVDFPVVFLGAIRAGIIPVPINPLSGAEQCAHILEDSRAVALVVGESLIGAAAPFFERAPHLRSLILAESKIVRDFPQFEVRLLEELIDKSPADPFTADTVSGEVAFWLYSSGTTGDPSAAQHVHTSPIATATHYGREILGIHADDVVFSTPRLSFAYGLSSSLSIPMSVGATTVLLPLRATAGTILELMREHRPTIFSSVPSIYASLIAHGDVGAGAGSDRLRLCISAGEALPAHLGKRWREATGLDIIDCIGSTEMLTMFICNRADDLRYGSSGKPLTGYEAKIVDDEGSVLRNGEIGELLIKGPTAAQNYWNQRAKSQRTFEGEWVHTRDKYYRDEDGFYFYCGRADDMFKVSGAWVSPNEVEAALTSHEAVADAAVIGAQDADGLTKPKAFVVLEPGVRADEKLFEALKLYVKAWGGARICPEWIEVREELPRTPNGKILRRKLRDAP